MNQAKAEYRRKVLIAELRKMKRLGFFVVDEAFDVADSMDMMEMEELSVSAAALLVKERGYAKYKSKIRMPIDEY